MAQAVRGSIVWVEITDPRGQNLKVSPSSNCDCHR